MRAAAEGSSARLSLSLSSSHLQPQGCCTIACRGTHFIGAQLPGSQLLRRPLQWWWPTTFPRASLWRRCDDADAATQASRNAHLPCLHATSALRPMTTSSSHPCLTARTRNTLPTPQCPVHSGHNYRMHILPLQTHHCLSHPSMSWPHPQVPYFPPLQSGADFTPQRCTDIVRQVAKRPDLELEASCDVLLPLAAVVPLFVAARFCRCRCLQKT